MHPKTLISRIESTAPLQLAAPWDKSGVQIASVADEIRVMCVALDPTVDTVRRAVELGANFLLCHHPLSLSPKLPSRLDDFHEILSLSLGNSLWMYSAHTSLDANPLGPVNWLGRALHLQDMRILEVTKRETPSVFRLRPAAGCPMVKGFEKACRRTGEVAEYTLWPEEAADFRTALGPGAAYEEMTLSAPSREYGFGCIGRLEQPLSWPDFSAKLNGVLKVRPRSVGLTPDSVTTVAYCPGSGADLAPVAFAAGADVYLTGDLKYHQAQAVMDLGLTLDVGHFCLEEAMMRIWSESLTRELSPDGVRVFFLPGCDPFA